MKRIPKSEIIFKVPDWKGREVVLLRSVLTQHIGRFHFDETFVLQALTAQFSRPDIVVENVGAKSEQAIYPIPTGGHPLLLVAIKYRKWMGRWFGNLIATLYGIDSSDVPKGRILWTK